MLLIAVQYIVILIECVRRLEFNHSEEVFRFQLVGAKTMGEHDNINAHTFIDCYNSLKCHRRLIVDHDKSVQP